jgi:hypothetical protein
MREFVNLLFAGGLDDAEFWARWPWAATRLAAQTNAKITPTPISFAGNTANYSRAELLI